MSNQEIKDIEKIFKSANLITLYQMYFKEQVGTSMNMEDIKNNNPGHLGTAMSINFILSNLLYFLNDKDIKTKLVIGTGHAGVALSSIDFLNGSWEDINVRYKRNKEGLNNLITDFGTTIRSEINPEYPNTIYDGGELGYGLATAYGYAISKDALIPCIIGDGELETGTALSSFQLCKTLNTKGKVLPIINLNGLKMGSSSFLSKLSKEEIITLFKIYGYEVEFVETTSNVENSINELQEALNKVISYKNPILIVKNEKGYTLPPVKGISFEANPDVHKNPLGKYSKQEKLEYLESFIQKNYVDLFDEDGNLLELYNHIMINDCKSNASDYEEVKEVETSRKAIRKIEDYLYEIVKRNDIKIFSPDELFSNQLGKLKDNTFEILNENILQGLLQGYIRSGKRGLYVAYEGFMPIISSMITQHYKYLYQSKGEVLPSATYFLTSTALENTYSHQNPDFVNALLEKQNSEYYNIYYPKNSDDTVLALNKSLSMNNTINIITKSKRHEDKYDLKSDETLTLETIIDCDNPSLILCATGDYMLDYVMELYTKLTKNGYNSIKVNYVTNPVVLREYDDELLNKFFNKDVPVIYLFTGYSYLIEALLGNRVTNRSVFGYNDGPSPKGSLISNYESNGIEMSHMEELAKQKVLTFRKND